MKPLYTWPSKRWLSLLVVLMMANIGSGNDAGMGRKQPKRLQLVLTCDSQSTIRANTTRADLVKRFGAENVHDEPIYVGEGMSEPGTVVFGDTPEKRVGIIWKDEARKAKPRSVRTSVILKQHSERHFEEVTPDTSAWRGPHGIKLGTTLKELERINRKPFRLAGFGWDGSGTVVSWQKGTLESKEPKCHLLLRPTPPEDKLAETNPVLGDQIFSSGHPAMQAVNPTVYQIVLSFEH